LAQKGNRRSIADFFHPESPEVTEFRRVLHNLNGACPENGKMAVLVTSSVLSEGKSVFSAYLAMTAAQQKKRKTLLLDFDLRRPMIHKLFALPIKEGVSDILQSGIASRNVTKKTPLEWLDIITAGGIIENTSEILTGAAIHRIVEEAKFYYDLLIFDAPPVVPVMDSIVILEEMDGALLVIKAGETHREVVMRARSALNSHQDKLIGIVVNNLKQILPYYYNYEYYRYKYKTPKK